MSVRYRGRLRRPDAGRLLLAIILIVLTTLIAMRGGTAPAGAEAASIHSVAR